MPIAINEYVRRNCKAMQEATEKGGAGADPLRPRWPVMLIFLGRHPEECRAELLHTMEVSWPSMSESVRDYIYATPADYERALSLNPATRSMELEDSLIALSDRERGYSDLSRTVMGYVLDINTPEAEEFIRLLDRDPGIYIGGVKDRFLFLMCHSARTAGRIEVKERLEQVRQYAADTGHRAAWEHTYVVTIDELLRNRQIMSQPEQMAEGYALAMDMLLIYASDRGGVGKLILQPVTETGTFITGALQRIRKPEMDIVRAVMRSYVEKCIELNRPNESGENIPPAELVFNCCGTMIEEYYQTFVRGQLPTQNDIYALPGRITDPSQAGETGPDRTFGCWRAFKQKYFVQAAQRLCGTREELLDRFEQQLSNMYTATVILNRFDAVCSQMRQMTGFRFGSDMSSLAAIGEEAAHRAFYEYTVPIMCEAMDRLRAAAKDYGNLLNTIRGQLMFEEEPDVYPRYRELTYNYMSGVHGLSEIMHRPCGEEELIERINNFFNNMLMNNQILKMSFENELRERLGQERASARISNQLNITQGTMENSVRMNILDIENLMGDFVLFNPAAEYAQGHLIGTPFALGRTDCVDRAAFVTYNPDRIQ